MWGHKPDGSTTLVHPLTSIQYWLIPEGRTIPQYDGIYYTLRSPQIHLLQQWQAVKTYDELRTRPAEGSFDLPEDQADGPITLYLGRDGESFYMDRAARDMRGVLADLRICEIAASEIRGCSLSEALRRLDKEEDRMVEEKWKPIMAERRRKAEAEAEGHDVEGHLVGSSKGAGEEEEPEEQEGPEGPTESSSPHVVEGRRCALPLTYVGNERPENTGKRKRCDLDQSQEPARPTTYVQQRSRSTLIRTIIISEKVDSSSSILLDDQSLASTSAPFAEIF